jgi:antitoxin component of MazEF toxin-antitoxin module
MKSRLARIGNSRGVRLPKTIIAQANLTDEVELGVRNGAVVIIPASSARSGWADAARPGKFMSAIMIGCLMLPLLRALTRRNGSGED